MAITKVTNSVVGSGSATDGYVLTADGSGNSAWEAAAGGGPTFKTFGTDSIMIGDTTTGTIDAADNNTGVGVDIFASLTSGDRNTAIGFNSLNDLTTGSQNSFVGSYAGDAITTGNYNSGVGDGALGNTTEGSNNSGFGRRALFQNTTASNNTAVGYGALEENTTGTQNTSLGSNTLKANTIGNYNTAIGTSALVSNTTASNNIAIGTAALEANTTASNNTAVGFLALEVNTTGSTNVAVGSNAGKANTTGAENTYIGYAAGQYMTAMTIGNRNVVLGAYSAPSTNNGNDQIVLGYSVRGTANATMTVGNNANTASLSLNGSDTSWAAASSDERLKENIETSKLGLNFINDLRPVNYNWKKAKDVPTYMPQYKEGSEEPVLGYEYGKSQHGFIAQECKAVQDKYVDDLADGFSFWIEKDDGTQTVADGNLIPVLVKAIQELSSKVEELESRLGD